MSDDEVERLLAEARKSMPPAPKPAPKPLATPPLPAMPELPNARAAAAAAPAREGFLSRLLGLRIASILTSRYVDLKLGDPVGTAILILQAPLIGFLIGLAFDGERESDRIQFVLAMVAVWLGTFSACREVVKERLIFLRERRTGVPIRAYLVSKVLVLACLTALQALLLILLVQRTVRFDTPLPLAFAALFVTALAANGLGLALSSLVKSQNALVALVPIALIPQLIFSDVLLPNPPPVVDRIELAMIADWGLSLLKELRKSEPGWLAVARDGVALLGMGVGFLLVAGICLRAQDE